MRVAKKHRQCRGSSQSVVRRNDHGSVLIVILVCLLAVTTILLSTMSTGIRYRQQTRTETQLEQTYLLLDAGIGKAIEKFQNDPLAEDEEIFLDKAMDSYNGWLNFNLVDRTEEQISLRVTAKLQAKHEIGRVTQRSRVIVLKRTSDQSEQDQEQTDEEKQ